MAMDSTLTRHDNLMPQRPGGMRKGTAWALLVHVGLLIALAFGVSWRSQTPTGVSAELWAAVPQIAAPPVVESKPVPAPTPKPTPAPTPPKVEVAPPKPSPTEAQIAIEKEKAERKQREQLEQQERERRELERKEIERKELERKELERKELERKEQARKEQERVEREKAEKLAAQKQRELEIRRDKEIALQREENLKRVLGQAGGTGAPNATGTAARDAGPSAISMRATAPSGICAPLSVTIGRSRSFSSESRSSRG